MRNVRCVWSARNLLLSFCIAVNLLPSGVVGSMLKHVDFVASDVPGVPVRLYLAGAAVTGICREPRMAGVCIRF